MKVVTAACVLIGLASIASAQLSPPSSSPPSTPTPSTPTPSTPTPSNATGSGLSGNNSFAGTVPGESTATSNAAQSFIGSNATQGFVGGASQAGNQQASNRQFQAIQNNQSQQSTGQQSGTVREIRTALRVGFAFPTASQSQINGRLASANLATLDRFTARRPELAGINVATNSSGIAVLSGSVPTVETRRLAANLMRLQPGVRKVDNQIVVQAN
ncbi:MAG: BON domain-containing protein [Planctomycetota bacterium]